MSDIKFFSESWHRVAPYCVRLKSNVRVHKQMYRGDTWYVLQDPLNNQFYRVRAAAYQFISRLRSGRTVEQVWRECLEFEPEQAPGQVEVLQLLGQLFQGNLLVSDLPPDSTQVFQKYKENKTKETQGRWMAFLTPRFPVLDPDEFLRRSLPFFRLVWSPVGTMAWLFVITLGLRSVISNWDEFTSSAQGLLAPDNLFYLYLITACIKLFHEYGHGAVCRLKGGQVHILGVMLILFIPMPYIDTTSSYAFRSKRDRLLVAAAGMILEFFLAGIAAIIWAATGPGTIHSLAFNVTILCSVTTILFNINPLLKFDGYYILCDLSMSPIS